MANRKLTLAIAAIVMLASCRQKSEQSYPGPAVLDHLVKGDEIPHGFFSEVAGMQGVSAPIEPSDIKGREAWLAWAKEAWPKACSAMDARLLSGELLPTRPCKAMQSHDDFFGGGYDVDKRGLLAIDDIKIPVRWSYTTPAKSADKACTGDPAGTGFHNYLIVRTGQRNWHLAAFHNVWPFSPRQDPAWESCQHLDRMLGNDRELETRRARPLR